LEADNSPDREIGLIGGVEHRAIRIFEYDASWRAKFQHHAHRISGALGDLPHRIEHIGSTAVENLAAKPIVDMLLIIPDPSDEGSYMPALRALGYQIRVREPDFHEHRMVRTPELDVHVHIFPDGSAEIDRYILFRDYIRSHEQSRREYEALKRKLSAEDWTDMNAYAAAKSDFIEGIINKALGY
jgi:GrpB-like predicted nucleotidyltransferase (UPF0157 family)